MNHATMITIPVKMTIHAKVVKKIHARMTTHANKVTKIPVKIATHAKAKRTMMVGFF